ncbi:MAG: right-handed parallel beta-helix repeat-containing protein [Limisphaerales bacterium]
MKTVVWTFSCFATFAAAVHGTEFNVATNGNDSNSGALTSQLRTVQRAADLAQPGDVIIVHQGIYRERVSPPRGGESDTKRITYEAAPGEKVVIKGSEVVTNWVKVQDNVWKATLPNSFFGNFNPYTNLIHGDWFNPLGRPHHTGAVYLNGDWLAEAANLEEVMKPAGANALWFGQVDKTNTTIWAQFKDVNPNHQLAEINARQTVFYPKKTGINYITVRGFTMEDAATQWAPPTAEQIGLIGPHWSKGWIIESNTICYSMCSGISLGKYGDQWDNTSANTAGGYVKTIERALTNGWSKENIGHHIVRDNVISHCEQAGIVGSLGGTFSSISNNVIHDIHVRNWFSGAEMAGIKLHGAIDVQIFHNHIYRTCLGLWLDWMAQGARISGNLFNNNGRDVFVEVDHGPFLMDNNLFLSPASLLSHSQGGAYIHNLFAGTIGANYFDARQTPFFKAHSTALAGFHNNPRGDDRYYNNIFVRRASLIAYDKSQLSVFMDGNVFLDGAKPSKFEKNPLVETNFNPALRLVQKADGFYLQIKFDSAWSHERTRKLVTTALLGKAVIPNLPYEQPDGSTIRIDTDYFGKSRNEKHPTPGPFANPGNGLLMLKVW